jgi:manganese transport protein
MAGTVFYQSGNHGIESIQDAHKLLQPLLGSKWAPILFAVALIAAGQSSTVTGTLAGQIIMEGYLQLRLNPVARRLLTRLLAIVPAVLVILIAGDKMVDDLLVFSQVLLSMQLAFAVIPLIHFVSDRAKMGTFTINIYTKIAAWAVAAAILYLNIRLFLESVFKWMAATDNNLIKLLIALFVAMVGVVLLITIFYPLILKRKAHETNIHPKIPAGLIADVQSEIFGTIALALDFSDKDEKVIQYAIRLAKAQSSFILIHVVESASAIALGHEADDTETLNDKAYLDEYVAMFTEIGYNAQGILGFKSRVAEIARIVKTSNADLLVIGSHGHKTAKDWLFGETINSVRHKIDIPVFIAR